MRSNWFLHFLKVCDYSFQKSATRGKRGEKDSGIPRQGISGLVRRLAEEWVCYLHLGTQAYMLAGVNILVNHRKF